MPLVVDQLQLWTIGFKLAQLDPGRCWFRIPLAAKDWFSTLLEAILKDHLGCMTLDMRKWDGKDREMAQFHIRYWLDEINLGIHHQRFSRKLLRHAVIDRRAFRDWCERRTIPVPEFWFPPGWTEYRYPEEDLEEDEVASSPPPTEAAPAAPEDEASDATASVDAYGPKPEPDPMGGEGGRTPRPSQQARIACQVIATNIWRADPDKTIASMSKDERLKLGDAGFYDEVTVKRWVQEVAPAHVSARRGRPKKKTPPESD